DAMAMRARLVNETAIDQITRPITQYHAAARIERRKNNFAAFAGRHDRAGFRVDDFNDSQIGIKLITGLFAVRARAFGPRHFRLGETVGGDDIYGFGPQFTSQPRESAAGAGRHFFAAQNDSAKIGAFHAFLYGLLQHMVEKRRHADEHMRLQLADEAQLAIRAEHFAAAAAEH